jgi:hypothetical protein
VSTAEVCARVLRGSPISIERLQADVPPDVVLIVARCLEKEPQRRYANVAELARALAPFGSSSARASADSIARVHEGGVEALSPPPSPSSAVGTMKPTAKAILAAVPKRRGRVSGYLGAFLLALAAVVAAVGGAGRYMGAFPLAVPLVAAASAPLPATSAAPPFTPPPVTMPVESALAPAAAAPHEASHERPHRRHHAPRPASASPVGSTGDEGDDAGPYDAP